ncbi:suco [Pungitius sinensis]
MKRLRVVLVCLIVALLCGYPGQYVSCSGPGPLGGGEDPEGPRQEQDEALEDPSTHTSCGLETERAAPEEHLHQTVNLEAPEPDPEPDPVPVAPEQEPPSGADVDPQTADPQDHERDQEAPEPPPPEPVPAQGQVETVIGGPPAQPGPDPNTPTSASAGPPHTGALRVASAGHELPADIFVSAEHSGAQCGVVPPDLATCENSPFGRPLFSVDEAGLEDPSPKAEDHVDQEQQLQDQLPDLEQEGSAPQGQQGDATTEDPSVPSKEDIPTFDEWKKQVMEVEKEKSQSLHTSSSGSLHPAKKVQKNFKNNYASVECGAKMLAANTEAKSTAAILMENMDLYMLNPCSNKIWFVIELCEPIQVKQLDIANFELFSSTPKDFLVSISDRYPTNKWVKLGTFHARDERIVQSFPLDEQLYAKYVKMFIKYIKVELLSHFGSEHFCPLSLIRVFGTSMVEEYEEISDSQYPSERLEYLDEDYDYPPGFQLSEDKASKNLLGSATNAILNMVNNILGGKAELEGGAELGGNATAGGQEERTEGPEAPDPSSELEAGLPVAAEDPPEPPPSSPDSPVDRKIVTLVEEDEEDEEPRQSTVTLMEGEEEEEREEADQNQWESRTSCPSPSSPPSPPLSLSCMATLPELLHRWCCARLARLRLRRRQLGPRSRPPPLQKEADQPPTSADPVPPPLTDAPPPAEPAQELPLEGQDEGGGTSGEAQTTDAPPTTPPHSPELNVLLEPSRTAALPPRSFSGDHGSLASSTPSHEEKPLPPVEDAPAPTPPLLAVTAPETQQGSAATMELTSSSPPLAVASETASPSPVAPPLEERLVQSLPTALKPEDLNPPPTELPTDAHTDSGGEVVPPPQHQREGDPFSHVGDPPQGEDGLDEDLLGANVHRAATDFYAELQNGGGVMGNGGAGGGVHGSSQKESVFMRLNNRIKALEMNMSLSSRYLEELSQRYRKQMEEMQRAFNKTVIKLQNTSRIAEEQDQKQTESIQVLQSQLENVTKLMLNLTATVGQLQREVSDRQSYLVVSLVLCLSLGLLLCLQCCRSSPPLATTIAAALPKSNHYPSPKRCFSSYDDMSLKRRVTCPLVRSKSFHMTTSEVGPDDLYIVEPLRFSPEKKKKRYKSKSLDKVEDLDPSAHLANGGPSCSGFQPFLPVPPPPPPLPPASFPPPPPPPAEEASPPACPSKEFPSETSSSSTHSEESYAGRLPPPSPVLPAPGLSNGHPLPFLLQRPPVRPERRSVKRRKSRQTELRFPAMQGGGVASLPSLQQLMKGNEEMGVGAIGVTAVGGHV